SGPHAVRSDERPAWEPGPRRAGRRPRPARRRAGYGQGDQPTRGPWPPCLEVRTRDRRAGPHRRGPAPPPRPPPPPPPRPRPPPPAPPSFRGAISTKGQGPPRWHPRTPPAGRGARHGVAAPAGRRGGRPDRVVRGEPSLPPRSADEGFLALNGRRRRAVDDLS